MDTESSGLRASRNRAGSDYSSKKQTSLEDDGDNENEMVPSTNAGLRRSRSYNDFHIKGPPHPKSPAPFRTPGNPAPSYGYYKPTQPSFDIDEFYAAEAALTLEQRRARYKTLEPVTLPDILSWPEYSRGLNQLDAKTLKKDWEKTMKMEREWKQESDFPSPSGFSGFGGFGGFGHQQKTEPSDKGKNEAQGAKSAKNSTKDSKPDKTTKEEVEATGPNKDATPAPTPTPTPAPSDDHVDAIISEASTTSAPTSLADPVRKPRPPRMVYVDSSDEDSEESEDKYEEEPHVVYAVDEEINSRIALWQGDICSLEIGGIVNAANESLLGGGGIDGAIHSAAGSTLRQECALLNGADPGQTKTSLGHHLPATRIFHTVGPRVLGHGKYLPKAVLESCYTTTLKEMVRTKTRSVAFCAISTGIFGYPLQCATHSACKIVRQWLSKKSNQNKVDRIIFCVYSDADKAEYEKTMQYYFPLPPGRVNAGTSHLPSVLLPHQDEKRWNSILEIGEPLRKGGKLNFPDLQTFLTTVSGSKDLDVSGLSAFLTDLPDPQREKFFKTTLPGITALALDFPKLLEEEYKQAGHLQDCIERDIQEKQAKRDHERDLEQKKIDKMRNARWDMQFLLTGVPTPIPPPKRQPPVPALPDFMLGGVAELVYMKDTRVVFRHAKVAGLLCQAFLCLFPPVINFTTNEKEVHPFNLQHVYGAAKNAKAQAIKLKCLLNYFTRVTESMPQGFLTIRRKVVSLKRLPDFDTPDMFLCSVKHDSAPMSHAYSKQSSVVQLYSTKEHYRACADAFHHDGFLSSWEVRCFESPELLVLNLLSIKLLIGESFVVTGALSVNRLDGHKDNLTFGEALALPHAPVTDISVQIEAMIRCPVPEISSPIIITNAFENSNPARHHDRTIFLGKELSRVYMALLPQELDWHGNTFTPKIPDFTLATTDFGCSSGYGCPPATKFLLLALTISQLNGAHLRLHGADIPKDSQIEALSKLCAKEHVELQFVWQQLRSGIKLPLHKVKIGEKPAKPVPAIEADDIAGVYASLTNRFQYWKKEKKAEEDYRRQLQAEYAAQSQLFEPKISKQNSVSYSFFRQQKEFEKLKKEQRRFDKEREKEREKAAGATHPKGFHFPKPFNSDKAEKSHSFSDKYRDDRDRPRGW